MQSKHKSVLSSKAVPFHPKPYALPPNFLTHTALVPTPSQVSKGLHHFLARCIEESWAVESNGPVPGLCLCPVPPVQPGMNTSGHRLGSQTMAVIPFMASVSFLPLSLAPDLNTPRGPCACWFCSRLSLHGLWLPYS